MNNNFSEQYSRTPVHHEESAYRAHPRPSAEQTSYRQDPGYTPRYARPAAPMYTDIYSSSSAYRQSGRKKKKSKLSAGSAAMIMVVCILLSGFAGFGGSYLYSQATASSDDTAGDQLVVNKVSDDHISTASVSLTDKSTNEIVAEVADSVVEITTEVVQTSGFYGQYVAQGAGSGVIISDDGYILTNNHVIDGAYNINVTLRSGESYEAKVIGADEDADIALLKIEASGLTAATLGDSSAVNVGDKSVIIGNPLGTLGGSVTEGIVSAVDRTLELDGKTMNLMQTDAAVNPGNSGGGMFNGQGELVGIVVAKSTGSSSGGSVDNIGFVIPINHALEILDDLKQYGYVRGNAAA